MSTLIPGEELNDLEKAKLLLKQSRKRLEKLRRIPLLKRGHLDNEEYVRLMIKVVVIKNAISILKRRKTPKGTKTKKRKKQERFHNGEYV